MRSLSIPLHGTPAFWNRVGYSRTPRPPNFQSEARVIPVGIVFFSIYPNENPMKQSAALKGELSRILFLVFLSLVFLALFFLPSLAQLF